MIGDRTSHYPFQEEHDHGKCITGMKTTEIADQMNMPARTIRHWLARGSAPDFRHRWSRSQTHLSGPLQAYLLERWRQGCHNVLQLERELRSRGYKGSRRSLYRMIATFAPSPTTLERRREEPLSTNQRPMPLHLSLP
jgi:hypothetical protein